MDNSLDAAFEAAAGKLTTPETGKVEEAPAKTAEAVPQDNNGKVPEPSTPKEEQKDEWDGDINKLPETLQPWAKKAQREFTKKAMAEAELRRKGEEYLALQQSEDWKKFQEVKSAPVQRVEQPTQPSGITQEEWEEAQLDSTGAVAQKLIQREAQKLVDAAVQKFGGTVQTLQQQNEIAHNRTVLSSFVDTHPDAVQLHEDGLMKPLLEQEVRSGQHQTYEAALIAAYETAKRISEANEARALAKAQGRVAEKKGAVTSTGKDTGERTFVEVGNHEDAFMQAFENAAQNKKVKVKLKK